MTIGYVATWDDSPSSAVDGMIITKIQRRLIGAIRDKAVDVPGKDGAWLFTERKGNRIIEAEVVVFSETQERYHAVEGVADWFDKDGYRRLIFDDQPERYWNASITSDADVDEWKRLGRFVLAWTAEPYAWAVSTSEHCATAADNVEYELSLPDSVDAFPVIEITPLNGTIVGFTLSVNDDNLEYDGTIAQGDTITISSLSYTVTVGVNLDVDLTGALEPGVVFPADVDGEFPVLLEGTNYWSLNWGGTATAVRVCFNWRRRYRR